MSQSSRKKNEQTIKIKPSTCISTK